jgi:putative aldouronate transport system substrate-binding protein
MPKTTDDLTNVLRAFRDGDPNGNGKQDEIGVYGCQTGAYGQNITAALMNSFEFWNGNSMNGGLALDKDGKTVIAPFTTDGWKAGLTYLNGLYKEGLLAPSMFTDDATQFKATLNEDTNVVALTSFGSLSNYPDAATNKNFLEMKLMAPLAGPDGTCYSPYTEYTPDQDFFIFDGCKNVDLAIKLADEFYSAETSTIARFGEKGVDWTDDPTTLSTMTNAYVEAGLYDKLTLAYISNYWLEPSARTWHNVYPRYASLQTMNTVVNGMKKYNPDDPTQLSAQNYQYYSTKHPDKVLPLLHYTSDEAGQIQEALSNIPVYVNQAMAEFIIGARDIEGGWDTYLSELKSMGLEGWLACAQDSYGRTSNK